MTSLFEQDLHNEYCRISTLVEEDASRLNQAIIDKEKYDPASAEQLRRQAQTLCLEIFVQHDRYLSSGLLYRRAVCWANEYQAIIISQETAKAKLRWAIEWLKVAVDLALLVFTLGITNLYRLLLPKLVLNPYVIRGVVPTSLLRTFLTGLPRTGYVTVSGPVLARTGLFSLLRQGHIEKFLVFSLPMFLVKKAGKEIAQFLIPLLIASEVGVSPQDVASYANRISAGTPLPQPARTLVTFNEEQILSFLAQISVQFSDAVSRHPELRKLDADELEFIKAVIMMDFWLNVSSQVEQTYFNARMRILQMEAELRELRDRTWHENWKRQVESRKP